VGGSGVLVDLASAGRTVSQLGVGDQYQVWLAPGAGPQLVDRLREHGLVILTDDSVAGRRHLLERQGPAAALRFGLLTAIVGVVLAAAAVAVAGAVERGPRAGELAALRVQGLSARSIKQIGYGGSATLVLAGVLAGLLATVVARVLADIGLPLFTDGWAVFPPPTGLHPVPVLLADLAATGVLAGVGLATGYRLGRAVDGTRPGGRAS
jgi:hypothetical protein